MKKMMLLTMGLGMAGAFAAVDMNIGTCVAATPTTVDYVNNTPDPWDMRAYNFMAGAGIKNRNTFPLQPSGNYLVLPGAKASPYFASCNNAVGAPYHKQLESKIGSCNEPLPPQEPVALKCAEVNTSKADFYDPNQCIKDGLGINRGDGYGGFIDSYRDQTQIQVAVPTGTFQMGGQTVKFDPASMGGPFYMMSLVALQEYLYVDMQFLAAMGASTSGAGLTDATGTSLYKSPANTGLDTAPYGSFTVTYQTAVGRLGKDYPKYFPTPMKLEKLVSTGGATGGVTAANSPQQINSALLASMNLWWLFDGLKAAQDLCFKQFLEEAKDKSAGLKLMLGGYHIGPNAVDQGTGLTDYANHVLPTAPGAAILNDADVTARMKSFPWDMGPPPGPDHATHNYITRVFSVVNQLVAANPSSKACGGALNIYDAPITKPQVKELFFGQGGTAATQGNGGLLWHFQIDGTARAALWTDLDCVFDQLALATKSPYAGTGNISYRYDFLTVLRVARQYFGGYVNKFADRPTPADSYSSDYAIWVANHSRTPCTRTTQDVTWPVMTLADTVFNKGTKLAGSFTDDRGIREYAFSTDSLWRQWIPTDANFAVPLTHPDKSKLWFRIIDSCGNATIEQVIVKNLPPPPQLPKPTADPAGTNFFANLNVTLKDSLATAKIFYTTDGSVPAGAAGGVTKEFVPGVPIVISGVTTTIKAIAVATGWRNSEIMVETYTKVAMPVVLTPKATPAGGDFSSLSAGVSVTLTTETVGAVIWYTDDGSVPDTTKPTTKKYGGTAILITVSTTLKAIATKAEHLNSGVMTEIYTRVVPPTVATPTANPPGRNFITPLSVTLGTTTALADIYYTENGSDPVIGAAGTTKYTGPIAITATKTLKAIAVKADLLPSGIMIENYVFTPPLSVTKAWYKDLNGDGRIETVILDFDKDLPVVPDKLTFKIADETLQTNERVAAKAEIAFASGSKSRVVVTLATPFPFGVTSVTNGPTSGQLHVQDNIPLMDNPFAVEDSVPPVILNATVVEPDSAHPEKRILLTLSEKTNLPLSTQTVLVFKHEGVEAAAGEVRIKSMEMVGNRDFTVKVDTNSGIYPIVGDSVALAPGGEVYDVARNAPSHKTFKRLDGIVPKPKPTEIYVTFPNSKKDKASDGPEPQGDVVFIPMDGMGNALSGSPADGKCSGMCFTGESGTFVGPVFHIVTAGPLTYEFSIFSNSGEFVARGKGRFEAKDLQLMTKANDASGIKYVARVIWTGRSSKGLKAGTGAYILQANLITEKDSKTGAPPAATKKRVVFGMLRSFKGS